MPKVMDVYNIVDIYGSSFLVCLNDFVPDDMVSAAYVCGADAIQEIAKREHGCPKCQIYAHTKAKFCPECGKRLPNRKIRKKGGRQMMVNIIAGCVAVGCAISLIIYKKKKRS